MPELGGPGGPLAPPIFGRSVNPIPTEGGQIIPTYYYRPPKKCHLPASLLPMNSPLHSTVFSFAKPIKTSIILKSVNSYPKQWKQIIFLIKLEVSKLIDVWRF